jgi:ketosteroid isomerase-like protein
MLNMVAALNLKMFTLLQIAFILSSGTCFSKPKPMMSKNKETVTRYMEGFNATDHSKILSCLTEDVVWELPGVYLHKGKAAFDKEIENEAFTGRPVINVSRLTEENNVVIAEGTVEAKKKDGVMLHIVFCDVFEMENGLIKKLTSYLMTKN